MGRRLPKILQESRLEKNLTLSEAEREKTGRILRMKGSLLMMEKLESWLDRLQETVLPPAGFKMAGVVLMEKEELDRVFLKDLRYFPLEQRISELKKIVRKRVQSAVSLLKDRYAESAEQMAGRIRASMRNSIQRQEKIRELYGVRDQRYREIDARAEAYLNGYRDKFPLPDLAGLYRAFLQECAPELLQEDSSLRQEDLPMLAMICRTVFGLKTKPLKHIVIDECQDFSPFQIELLKKTNPVATFSLVGDLYQGIRADEGIRSWDEWKGPVFEDRADLKQLTVSYRNTVEIMDLAQAVAGRYPIEGICGTKPVLRHGEPPRIVPAANEKERLVLVREQVQAWQAEGWHSIALIEKTAEQAKKLYRQIGPELDAHLLSETDSEYRGGVMILPASIAKGMEFDCVGICDASAENFPDDEFLCRILSVMMTRPLHRLCIWHKGAPSPMLPGS
jgi:DNA helicase-2/ATP-dependent DNA helicase PcrA